MLFWDDTSAINKDEEKKKKKREQTKGVCKAQPCGN
jgi:hypothetical protein